MIYKARPEFASLLEEAGLRQYELAERVGMSRFTLSHVAACRRNVGGAFAARIGKAYAEATSTTQEAALAALFEAVASSKATPRQRGARGRFVKGDNTSEMPAAPTGEVGAAEE